MKKYDENLNLLRNIALEYDRVRAASYFLMWDLYTETISSEAKLYRENMIVTLKTLLHKICASAELKECLDFFSKEKPRSDVDKGTVRELQRLRTESFEMTKEYSSKWEEAVLLAQDAWHLGHRGNSYDESKKALGKLFDLKKELYGSGVGSVFEQTLKLTEWDYSMSDIDTLFEELKVGLLDICQRVKTSCETVDDSLLWQKAPEVELKNLCTFLVEHMGYEANRGGYGEGHHPMCIPLGPNDVRLLNKYVSFAGAVFGILHEGGHGIYFQQHEASLTDTMHWGGHFGMVHESQARFFENIIGRSEEFWKPIYPKVKELFPKLEGTKLSDFMRMINKVKPSPVRVYADEVTYSLHIIIRYEIEKELLDGALTMDKLPERWNEKFKEYLGIEVKDYTNGVLQDPHWALGFIGYFQGYALGNLYGAQIWAHMKKANPEVIEKMAEHDMVPMIRWLKENVYVGGSVYTPKDIIKRVTGKELSVKPYLDYLEDKYKRLYKIN